MNGRIKNAEPKNNIPRIGIVKVGKKVSKPDGKEFPTSLDYFVPSGSFSDNFIKEFGENPKKILISFVYEDEKLICNERYEAWVNGKKIGSGDGITFEMYNELDKNYISVPYTHELVQNNKKNFNRMLTLKFVIPSLSGVWGHWEFTTRGNSSIDQIISVFDSVKDVAGRVSCIPFNLVVEMASSKKPNSISKYPVVKLIPALTSQSLELIKQYELNDTWGKIGVFTEEKIQKLINDKLKTEVSEEPKEDKPKKGKKNESEDLFENN